MLFFRFLIVICARKTREMWLLLFEMSPFENQVPIKIVAIATCNIHRASSLIYLFFLANVCVWMCDKIVRMPQVLFVTLMEWHSGALQQLVHVVHVAGSLTSLYFDFEFIQSIHIFLWASMRTNKNRAISQCKSHALKYLARIFGGFVFKMSTVQANEF